MTDERTGGGRTRITARALDRVVTRVTGEAFGAPGESVGVDLIDHGGELDLLVRTAISVVSIDRARSDSRAVDRMGGSVLERCTAAEEEIRDRVKQITGNEVRRVTVRLTGVHITKEKRVR